MGRLDPWADGIAGSDTLLDEGVDSDGALAQTATHYKMNHRRRGVAAIFNQERFDKSTVSVRRGSQQDCASLRRTFGRLGFEVEMFQDLTLAEIQAALEELSGRDHSDCDCLVVVFMSHGLEGKLRARDQIFDVNLLWDCFTAEHCSTLANKPKLFFIQACQGHDKQEAVRVSGPSTEDTPQQPESHVKLVPSYFLPDRADFLVAMSTIPGFVSWRSLQEGSWYIQTLCKHLDSQGFRQDILTLLTHVGRAVALDFTYKDQAGVKKQLPSVVTLLIRVLQFTRKRSKGRCISCGENEEGHEMAERIDVMREVTDGRKRRRSASSQQRRSLPCAKRKRIRK